MDLQAGRGVGKGVRHLPVGIQLDVGIVAVVAHGKAVNVIFGIIKGNQPGVGGLDSHAAAQQIIFHSIVGNRISNYKIQRPIGKGRIVPVGIGIGVVIYYSRIIRDPPDYEDRSWQWRA